MVMCKLFNKVFSTQQPKEYSSNSTMFQTVPPIPEGAQASSVVRHQKKFQSTSVPTDLFFPAAPILLCSEYLMNIFVVPYG